MKANNGTVSNFILERKILRKAKGLNDAQLIKFSGLCCFEFIRTKKLPVKISRTREILIGYILRYISDENLGMFYQAIKEDEISAFDLLLRHKGKYINYIKN